MGGAVSETVFRALLNSSSGLEGFLFNFLSTGAETGLQSETDIGFGSWPCWLSAHHLGGGNRESHVRDTLSTQSGPGEAPQWQASFRADTRAARPLCSC